MPDREKVIKGLKYLHDVKRWSPNESEESITARRNITGDALALLKAQEHNEDWISRKRLRDEIQYYIEEAGWGDEVNKVLGWCLEFIDNQETVKWE